MSFFEVISAVAFLSLDGGDQLGTVGLLVSDAKVGELVFSTPSGEKMHNDCW